MPVLPTPAPTPFLVNGRAPYGFNDGDDDDEGCKSHLPLSSSYIAPNSLLPRKPRVRNVVHPSTSWPKRLRQGSGDLIASHQRRQKGSRRIQTAAEVHRARGPSTRHPRRLWGHRLCNRHHSRRILLVARNGSWRRIVGIHFELGIPSLKGTLSPSVFALEENGYSALSNK